MSESVQGKCPSCGWPGLFLGSGGYVTCPQSDCKEPTLAADLLDMGKTLNDFVRSGAQVDHILKLQDELRGLMHAEPFTESFGAFLTKLAVGRNPSTTDTEATP